MESIKLYFETIPSWHRTLLLVAGLMFFYIIEYAFPFISMKYKKHRHASLNIFFTATTAVVNILLAFVIVYAADYTNNNHLGLLHISSMQLWLFILTGLLMMDLISAWFIHYLQHKIKWMWKFHIIHHTDVYVDATTANRHHPGESVFRFIFTLLAVVILGAPVWLVMLYQSLSALLSQFNHANISLPRWFDKMLSWIIVSPGMHKVHHHFVQPYTDSNYANIFSIWDRLFGTFRSLPRDQIIYGLDSHLDEKEHSSIGKLLKIPFQPYRAPAGSKFAETNESGTITNTG